VTRAIIAVVPFGTRTRGEGSPGGTRHGAWARQLARRLVERFAQETAVELRPVFLVAMPGAGEEGRAAPSAEAEPGYLIFGSAPDPKLAAEYGRSLEAAFALTGTYEESDGERRLAVTLVDVARAEAAATSEQSIGPGELHLAEGRLAAWLADALALDTSVDLRTPVAANERAYGALLEGMDAEVDVTLLRAGDLEAARAALADAAASYADAIRADPASSVVEDRILVMGATAIERDEQAIVLGALEALTETRPGSWRAHYMLGEVRRTSGDTAGAVVAFEHADAVQPLRDQDALLLARLHVATGAPATAVSRLARLIRRSEDVEVVASARRLRLSLQRPDLEKVLEEAGQAAVDGDPARAAAADAGFAQVLAVEPDIWEAHFGRGLLALQRGDAAAARSAFERARALNPASGALMPGLDAARD